MHEGDHLFTLEQISEKSLLVGRQDSSDHCGCSQSIPELPPMAVQCARSLSTWVSLHQLQVQGESQGH